MTEYIDREAAIKALCERSEPCFTESGEPTFKGDYIGAIASVPAADVRSVVKARWIHMPSDGKFRDTCVCSACKKSPPIESWIVQGFNACPYCFADMREGN